MTTADFSPPNAKVVELNRRRPRGDVGTTKNSDADPERAVRASLEVPEARRALTQRVFREVQSEFARAELKGASGLMVGVDVRNGHVFARDPLDHRGASGRLTSRTWCRVLGRHSEADILLPDDPSLSLRHAAIILPRGELGGLRVVDLKSGQGVRDAMGVERGSLASSAPFSFSIGPCLFLVAPPGSLSFEALASGWPEEHVESAPAARLSGARPTLRLIEAGRLGENVRRGGEAGSTVISREAPRIEIAHAARPDYILHVENAQRRVAVGLTEACLQQGVLLGRGSRCESADFMSAESISRTHGLLIATHGEVMLFDVASTNGILREPTGDDRTRNHRPLAQGPAYFGVDGAVKVTLEKVSESES